MLQAAADAGKLGIGVDSNQNYLHPGKVLTSMLKHVDVADLQLLHGRQGRHLEGRHRRRSASRKAASTTRSTTTTRALITPDMKAKVDAAKADIISGKIQVHDYMSDNKCPM